MGHQPHLPQTVATFMDDAGDSTRQIADQLGQADITTTQRHYLGREKVTRAAARALDAIQSRDGDRNPHGVDVTDRQLP